MDEVLLKSDVPGAAGSHVMLDENGDTIIKTEDCGCCDPPLTFSVCYGDFDSATLFNTGDGPFGVTTVARMLNFAGPGEEITFDLGSGSQNALCGGVPPDPTITFTYLGPDTGVRVEIFCDATLLGQTVIELPGCGHVQIGLGGQEHWHVPVTIFGETTDPEDHQCCPPYRPDANRLSLLFDINNPLYFPTGDIDFLDIEKLCTLPSGGAGGTFDWTATISPAEDAVWTENNLGLTNRAGFVTNRVDCHAEQLLFGWFVTTCDFEGEVLDPDDFTFPTCVGLTDDFVFYRCSITLGQGGSASIGVRYQQLITRFCPEDVIEDKTELIFTDAGTIIHRETIAPTDDINLQIWAPMMGGQARAIFNGTEYAPTGFIVPEGGGAGSSGGAGGGDGNGYIWPCEYMWSATANLTTSKSVSNGPSLGPHCMSTFRKSLVGFPPPPGP